jgi:predicted Zn-dependent protease
MSLLKFLRGKSAEDNERKADSLAAAGAWGKAKIAYDHALDKLEKSASNDPDSITRVREKIDACKEALAARHWRDAVEILENGAAQEARELVRLALELSGDPQRRSELKRLLEEIEGKLDLEARARAPEVTYQEPDEPERFETTDEEILRSLVGTLPEEVQQAYLSYGENFEIGYQALNRGDFETAAEYLTTAMDETPSPDSYIPLELATAYLNLGRQSDARRLLETFVETHPHALPGYQMLCEILWEQAEFDRADDLLDAVPPVVSESVAVTLLKGETRFRAGHFDAAKDLYSGFIRNYGWNESIARALARIHEARSETFEARALYAEMLQRCTGCGSRVDPEIKQKYADLSFAAGERTSAVLELYLALAREMPQNAAGCYGKVSRIYAAQGNQAEARRFRAFASQIGEAGPPELE